MPPLTRQDLLPLELYAEERPAFRAKVIAHKRLRTVQVGPNITVLFEDRLTIQYQVQEMLRIEKVFEPAGIQDELDAYNPLIPDGENLKATLLIEFPDPAERARELARLRGIEHHVVLDIEGAGRAVAAADEDLERSNDDKTSAVHFLRFPLDEAQQAALRRGASAVLAVTDARYGHSTVLGAELRASLATDLAAG